MLTIYQLVAAVALVTVGLWLLWLTVRSRRRRVRYVPVGLMARRYVIWLPIPRKQKIEVPVVFAFHAEGGTVEQLERDVALHMARAAARFVIVYPDGYHGSWNAGRCCGDAVKSRVDEMKFVRAILDDLASFLEIDDRRIYATGFSNGAMLCYYLACSMSDRIAAIAPVDGRLAVANCAPRRAVACFHFDRLADAPAPQEGGRIVSTEGEWSTADTVGFWRRANDLASVRRAQMFGGLADCTIYSGDDANVELRVCVIRQGRDESQGGAAGHGDRDASASLRAQVNEAILDFFADKVLPEKKPQRIRIDLH